MPDILIRDVPEDVAQALTEKALRDGTMDRQAWLRKKLTELARVPERYAFRVYGQSGGKGAIRRHSDHPNGTSTTFSNFSQPEASAMEQAENLCSPATRGRKVRDNDNETETLRNTRGIEGLSRRGARWYDLRYPSF